MRVVVVVVVDYPYHVIVSVVALAPVLANLVKKINAAESHTHEYI